MTRFFLSWSYDAEIIVSVRSDPSWVFVPVPSISRLVWSLLSSFKFSPAATSTVLKFNPDTIFIIAKHKTPIIARDINIDKLMPLFVMIFTFGGFLTFEKRFSSSFISFFTSLKILLSRFDFELILFILKSFILKIIARFILL